MTVDVPGQNVLERTSVQVQADGSVEARFTVALPARGRSVLGQCAAGGGGYRCQRCLLVPIPKLQGSIPSARC